MLSSLCVWWALLVHCSGSLPLWRYQSECHLGLLCWDAVLCYKLFRTYVSRKAADQGRVVHKVRCDVFAEALSGA